MVTEAVARDVHLSAYVNLGLDDVLSRFQLEDAATLLEGAIRAALRPPDQLVRLEPHPLEHVVNYSARMSVTWHIAGTRRAIEGNASMSFLVVQSGKEPMTEILVTFPVTDDIAEPAVAVARRFLDELTVRLADAPA